MNILIVDDEINALQAFLKEIVGEGEMEYHFFTDDEKAILKYIKYHDVDGVFLDINMPRINGIDLARKIIEIKKTTKIAIITGTNLKMNDVPENVKKNIISIIYKPYSKDNLQSSINVMGEIKPILTIKMFNGFDCFVNNHIVEFSSSKSKELFALLIALNGNSLTMSQAITYLWPNKDNEKAKILYRDAVWRLRETLEEIRFPCVSFGRAILTLDKSNIKCDYYDYLSKKRRLKDSDIFLISYDWADEFI